MALGGGIFTTQNKVLPGSYINFVSASKASANLSDRGIATMPLELDWGTDNAVFEVTPADFQKNSLSIFGYPFTHDKLKGLREVMDKVRTLYAYKLTSAGAKAANTYATAKCCGTRGNDLKVVIGANVDAPEKFDVSLYLGTTLVDTQTGVAKAADLVDNDYVVWEDGASLAETAGTALTGGTNGTVDGTAHQKYLDKIEPYTYNTMGVVTTDETTKSLYAAFVKRMCEDVGAKFQCVLYNKAADYEGVINVKNRVLDESASEASLVYWVTGAEAACAVNKSLLNVKYDGAYTVNTDYKQSELETFIKSGIFAMHNVSGETRVLSDINSFVSDTEGKSKEIFGDNQCIRVMDQIANDIAVLFNTRYLGKVPNDASGRVSLWNDIVKHHQQLEDLRAIENFSADDVQVEQGDAKNSVAVQDAVTIVCAMAKLYMTVTVS